MDEETENKRVTLTDKANARLAQIQKLFKDGHKIHVAETRIVEGALDLYYQMHKEGGSKK